MINYDELEKVYVQAKEKLSDGNHDTTIKMLCQIDSRLKRYRGKNNDRQLYLAFSKCIHFLRGIDVCYEERQRMIKLIHADDIKPEENNI